jgi:nucleotide-binding universal stress UspA family protein
MKPTDGARAIVVGIDGSTAAINAAQWAIDEAISRAIPNSVIGIGALWPAVCIGFAVIGLYLTYVGWMPASRRSASQAAHVI